MRFRILQVECGHAGEPPEVLFNVTNGDRIIFTGTLNECERELAECERISRALSGAVACVVVTPK